MDIKIPMKSTIHILKKIIYGTQSTKLQQCKKKICVQSSKHQNKVSLSPIMVPSSSRDGSARLLSMVQFSLPNKRLLPSLGSSPRCSPLASCHCCSLARPLLLRTLLVSWPCYGQTYHCFLYVQLRLRARHGHNVRQAPYITHCRA
jgi:hypothetical protein